MAKVGREFGTVLLAVGLAGVAVEGVNAADLYFRSAPAIVRAFVPSVPSSADASRAQTIIDAYHGAVDILGDQGKLSEVPAATRDNPNLALAFETRGRAKAAVDAQRKIWQIHLPLDAALTALSLGAAAVGGFFRFRPRRTPAKGTR